jgi:hypothetical protein
VEKRIKEHMDEFSKGLGEYKQINEKNMELLKTLDDLPYERVAKVISIVGEIITLSVEATIKGYQEAERIAEVFSDECNHEDYVSQDDGYMYCPDCNEAFRESE